MYTVQQRFDFWFSEPMEALRKLPNGNGGFVALATALPLFERYHVALKTSNPARTTARSEEQQLAVDFGLTESDATKIWDWMRNGMLHGVAVKNECTLSISGNHTNILELTPGNPPTFKLNIWRFVERVLSLWKPHMDLFGASKPFPLPQVYAVPGNSVTFSGAFAITGVLPVACHSDDEHSTQ